MGRDIPAGRYKTTGPASPDVLDWCYWARLKDDSGNFDAIIANATVKGPTSVTVNAGEFVEFNGGCRWTRQ